MLFIVVDYDERGHFEEYKISPCIKLLTMMMQIMYYGRGYFCTMPFFQVDILP